MIYKFLLKMACLNLMRSPKRSVITVMSICVGVLGSLVFYGYMQYTYWGLSENFARSGNGHVQIARSSWFGSSTPEKERSEIRDLSEIETHILEDPALAKLIEGSSLKRTFSGVIGTGEGSTVFVADAVDPEGQISLSSWSPVNLGENIIEEEPYGVVIGRRMAERLELAIGDSASLLVSTDDGRMNAIDVSILGLLESRSRDIEAVRLIIPFSTAIASLQSKQADYLALSLYDTETTDLAIIKLQRIMEQYPGFQAKPWHEVADFYLGVKNLNDRLFLIFLVILSLVSLLAMSNTIHMSIMERNDEIGILRSIGIFRRFISFLFIHETVILALVGCTVGAGLALTIAGGIDLIGGIPMPPPPGANKGYNLKLFIDWKGVAIVMSITLFSAALASVFPVRTASRRKIIDLLLKTAVILCAIVPAIGISSESQDLDGKELLQKINSQFPYPKDIPFLAEVEFQHLIDGKEKSKVVYRSASQGYNKIAVAVSGAKRQRMAVLRTTKGVWIQKEGSRLQLRISPTQRIVGEASIGDILDVRFNGVDYQVKSLSRKNGVSFLELKGVGREASYGSIVLEFDEQSSQLKEIQYFALSGKMIKKGLPIYLDKDRILDGITVVDAINPKRQTKVSFLGVRPVKEWPLSFYAKAKLSRSTKKIIKEQVR